MKATCHLLCFILRYPATKGTEQHEIQLPQTGCLVWWVCDVTSIQCTYVHIRTEWPQNFAPGNEARVYSWKSHNKSLHEWGAISLTRHLWFVSGNRRGRAKGSSLLCCSWKRCMYIQHIPNFQLCTELQSEFSKQKMNAVKNYVYNLYSCKWLYLKPMVHRAAEGRERACNIHRQQNAECY